MRTWKKEMILSVLFCLLPILLGISLWGVLPEKVPTHFNMNNEPDGYSSKIFAVFGLPCLLAALDALCLFALRADPKRNRQPRVLQHMMLWFLPLLSCVMMSITFFAALGNDVNISFYLQILIGVMFIAIGNYLPKCRQNYTMGIRLPWTLDDEKNWNSTHRLGGFCWVIGGVLMLLNSVVGYAWLFFVITAVAVLVPVAASYCYAQKRKREDEK